MRSRNNFSDSFLARKCCDGGQTFSPFVNRPSISSISVAWIRSLNMTSTTTAWCWSDSRTLLDSCTAFRFSGRDVRLDESVTRMKWKTRNNLAWNKVCLNYYSLLSLTLRWISQSRQSRLPAEPSYVRTRSRCSAYSVSTHLRAQQLLQPVHSIAYDSLSSIVGFTHLLELPDDWKLVTLGVNTAKLLNDKGIITFVDDGTVTGARKRVLWLLQFT